MSETHKTRIAESFLQACLGWIFSNLPGWKRWIFIVLSVMLCVGSQSENPVVQEFVGSALVWCVVIVSALTSLARFSSRSTGSQLSETLMHVLAIVGFAVMVYGATLEQSRYYALSFLYISFAVYWYVSIIGDVLVGIALLWRERGILASNPPEPRRIVLGTAMMSAGVFYITALWLGAFDGMIQNAIVWVL